MCEASHCQFTGMKQQTRMFSRDRGWPLRYYCSYKLLAVFRTVFRIMRVTVAKTVDPMKNTDFLWEEYRLNKVAIQSKSICYIL